MTNHKERTVHPPNGTRRFYGLASLVWVGCMHFPGKSETLSSPESTATPKCCPTRMCERDVYRMLQVDKWVGHGSVIGAIWEDPR